MSSTVATLNLVGKALTPGAQRSWWLREALAAEKDSEPRPLKGDINADVVIIGGGFTGLWTAYHLTLAQPDLRVVVLEQSKASLPRRTRSTTSRGHRSDTCRAQRRFEGGA